MKPPGNQRSHAGERKNILKSESSQQNLKEPEAEAMRAAGGRSPPTLRRWWWCVHRGAGGGGAGRGSAGSQTSWPGAFSEANAADGFKGWVLAGKTPVVGSGAPRSEPRPGKVTAIVRMGVSQDPHALRMLTAFTPILPSRSPRARAPVPSASRTDSCWLET